MELSCPYLKNAEPVTSKSLPVFDISKKQLITIGRRFDQIYSFSKRISNWKFLRLPKSQRPAHLKHFKFDLANKTDDDSAIFLDHYLKLINQC